MKDRLFLVLFTFGVIALLAAVVMPWAAKQNAINEAILTKLNALSPPPVPATRPALPENWASLKVRVHEEGTGRPLEKVYVQCLGKPFTDADKNQLMEWTDSQGVASVGPIRPGPYEVRVYAKIDGDVQLTSATEYVTLYAGQEREISFTRPSGNFASDLTLHVSAPEYLRKLGCIAVYKLQQKPLYSRDTTWVGPYDSRLAIEMGGNVWGDFTNRPLRAECDAPVSKPFPLRWASSVYQITDVKICQPVSGKPDCWSDIASYSPKDLAFKTQPGACRVELPLPQELMDKALVSPYLAAPVTFRTVGIENPSDQYLISLVVNQAPLDAGQPATPNKPTIWLTGDGHGIASDSLNVMSSPTGYRLRYPELKMEGVQLGLGRYSVIAIYLCRREERSDGQRIWRPCGKQQVFPIEKPLSSFEVRIDRKNEVTIQIPKDVLQQCTATATATHPE